MAYNVRYSNRAVKQLKKIDKRTASLILAWIEKNLVGCKNPRLHGKPLAANLAGQWSYRIGDYRLIAEISDKTITIMIVNIGHRREVYK